MELAQTNDTLAQAYARQGSCPLYFNPPPSLTCYDLNVGSLPNAGDFQTACHYSEQSYKAVEVVYGSNSIELANESQKLAQLFFHW